MRTRWRGWALGLGLSAAAMLSPHDAKACGGGVFSVDESVSVGGQRVFLSVRADKTTDVVVQLDVTGTTRYGALLPLPSEPTLDTEPVASSELDGVDRLTRVTFSSAEEPALTESSGCGSTTDGFGAANLGGVDGSVTVTSFAKIGPVQAIVLKADSGAALAAWLDENGFTVGDGDQAILDQYVGGSRHFIAFKRADDQPARGHESLGVHFTLKGDERGYPLRMAKIGAASELAITVFVAAPFGVAPGSPFQALTLSNLGRVDGYDEASIAASYGDAVRAAVKKAGSKAFLVENVVVDGEAIDATQSPRLRSFVDSGAMITRLTTILDRTTLDADVAFTAPAPSNVTNEKELGQGVDASPQAPVRPAFLFTFLAPAMLALRKRSARRGG